MAYNLSYQVCHLSNLYLFVFCHSIIISLELFGEIWIMPIKVIMQNWWITLCVCLIFAGQPMQYGDFSCEWVVVEPTTWVDLDPTTRYVNDVRNVKETMILREKPNEEKTTGRRGRIFLLYPGEYNRIDKTIRFIPLFSSLYMCFLRFPFLFIFDSVSICLYQSLPFFQWLLRIFYALIW